MTAVATAPKTSKVPYRGPQTGGGPYKDKKGGRPAPKGGSKYAKKHKGRPKPKPVKRGEPVFLYYVQGTDIRATKAPCERDPAATKDKPSQSPLGTWKNPLTGKKCKVTRVRNKPEVDAVQPQA